MTGAFDKHREQDSCVEGERSIACSHGDKTGSNALRSVAPIAVAALADGGGASLMD